MKRDIYKICFEEQFEWGGWERITAPKYYKKENAIKQYEKEIEYYNKIVNDNPNKYVKFVIKIRKNNRVWKKIIITDKTK